MYATTDDPYCYPGSAVLRNIPGHRKQKLLDQFELAMTTQRFDEPLPNGRFGLPHYCAIHHHLFQDVYSWAGKLRTVRIARGKSMFCYPEHIRTELNRVFADLKTRNALRRMTATDFAAGAAWLLSEINAIHAFRDGNGRSQLAFVALLAHRAGHDFKLENLRPKKFLAAMIASFGGNEGLLKAELLRLVD